MLLKQKTEKLLIYSVLSIAAVNLSLPWKFRAGAESDNAGIVNARVKEPNTDNAGTAASDLKSSAPVLSSAPLLTDTLKREGVLLHKGILYKSLRTESGAVAHVVLVDTKCGAVRARTHLSDTTETTSFMAAKEKALVAVNGGYFNLSDGESASYVFVDGKQLCEPKHNMALVNNPGLIPFLPRIFNRSEIRFLKGPGGRRIMRIQAHDDPLPAGCKLVDSLQAGPELWPRLTAREEAFIRGNGKEVDSIGSALKTARTACGITNSGELLIVCVEGRKTKEFSEGVSLEELAAFIRRFACTAAINFDGGSSTTMVLRLPRSVRLTGTQAPESPINGGGHGNGQLDSPRPQSSRAENGMGEGTDSKQWQSQKAVNKEPDLAPVDKSLEEGSSAQGENHQDLTTVFSASPERRVKSILYIEAK